LREVLKDVKKLYILKKKEYYNFLGYQVLNESLKWLRDKNLRYGKNAPYDLDLNYKQSNEIDNPQPSS
jgi:hypothetical protein